jgi:predicted  nucleic acid-binding Zn-ribbon protein
MAFDPLLPKWNKTKGQSETLKNGKLKPDIVPAIKQYDKAGTDYDKLEEEDKKLQELLKKFDSKLSSDGEKYDKLIQQRDKVKEEDDAKFTQYSEELDGHKNNPDVDPAKVLQTLKGFIDTGTDFSSTTKSLNDQITKIELEMLSAIKKTRDEYKSKSDSIAAQEKKLEAAGKAAEAQIRSIAQTYQNTATKSNDMDTVKAVREFLKEL